jgi:ATP-dependent Clp protease adaptor protein ClpS
MGLWDWFWGRYGTEDDDWGGGPEPESDDPAVAQEPENDYSAAAPGPQYHLVILNDDTHSFDYVIRLFQDVFSIPLARSVALTCEIHSQGRAVVFTGSLDEVNNKRTQVIIYGPDTSVPNSVGPLSVVIEKTR